jgi:hypothetical protein
VNRSRPRLARRVAGPGLVALLAGFAACYAPPAADAAITPFALAPQAGPPGTVVHVSGAGCSPGLLDSPKTDFVRVTAPTLGVVLRAPVSASGAWSGSFIVPADGGSGSSAVAAVCVSSGLLSLTTIYSPQTFTVTSPPSTTKPGPSTTRPGSRGTTPASRPTPGSNPPDHPSTVVGGPSAGPHVTGDTAGTRGTSPGAPSAPAASHAPSTTRAPVNAKHSASAGPAALPQVDLGSYVGSGYDSGLGWLGGLLLLVLLIAAVGATFLIWRARRARNAAADGETV